MDLFLRRSHDVAALWRWFNSSGKNSRISQRSLFYFWRQNNSAQPRQILSLGLAIVFVRRRVVAGIVVVGHSLAIAMTLSWNRVLSALLAVLYLIIAFLAAGGEGAFKLAIFLIFPLVCIWFSEAMGDYVGPTWSGPSISTPTPGIFICIAGWLLLLLPVIILIIATVSS